MSTRTKRWPKVLGIFVVVLVAVLAIGAQVMDSYLLKRVRAEADTYSKQLGRPIRIGDLDTKFLTGFGVRLQDLEVGEGEGEGAPLMKLGRAEVKVALLPALTSGGREVRIRSFEIEGLNVNVVKLPDGTTNVERVQSEWEKAQPSEPAQPETAPGQEEEADLSAFTVEDFELSDGQIRFIDKTGPAAKELAISRLDIDVEDLRTGKPLEVKIRAAVLAAEQNFELEARSTPLPKTLQPTFEAVSLKVKPIDLAPLAAFMPKEAGFQAGRIEADLNAVLGAAVPNGTGPTQVKGSVRALGLSFAGAEGGKPLDVTLESDLNGDAVKGELDIRKLAFNAGPAGIDGKGKVQGLLTETPSVQGLEITGHDLDPAVLSTYYPPLKKQLGGEVAGPIGLAVRASGSQSAQSVMAELDFTPVRLNFPDQLSKPAGTPMKITAHLKGGSNGALRFDTVADLLGVDLRPGGNVNKAPGAPLRIEASGTYKSLDTSKSTGGGSRIDLASLVTKILDDTLTGKGFVELRPTRGGGSTKNFDMTMSGNTLDLDKLLIPEETAATGGTPGQGGPAGQGGTVEEEVTPEETYAGLKGHLAMKLDTLISKKMEMKNVVMDVQMVNDRITVSTLTMNLYGGKVDASGTTMKLAGRAPPFEVKAKISGVDVAAALARRTPHQILSGRLNADVNVSGAGKEKVDLTETLAGAITGQIGDGEFLGSDLVSNVTGPLAKALPFVKSVGKVSALSTKSATALGKELPFGVELSNGVAKLKKPLQVTRPDASLSFDGGIGLDGMLNLVGSISLPPSTVQAITGGKAKVTEPVPVALKVTGPAWAPKITDMDLKPAATTIAKGAVSGLATQYLGEKGKVVDQVIQGNAKAAAESALKQQQQEAERKAAEEKAKAEARAREEAAKAKKQAEDEAKKRLKGLFGR